MLAARRLPGVRIDVAPAPPAEALPRMDVAVLIGFASTGPLHVPVAVESVIQYSAIFGKDAPLAWDATRGQRVHAYLGPAVRAFFANGGRRCWVVRVARTAALQARRDDAESPLAAVATANEFSIPGVLEARAAGIGSAIAQARCEGSWSDALRVATALSQRRFSVADFAALASPSGPHYGFRTAQALTRGDLLMLGNGAEPTYAIVEQVLTEAVGGRTPNRVDIRICAAFEAIDAGAAGASASPLSQGVITVRGFCDGISAVLVPPDERDVPGASGARGAPGVAPSRLQFVSPVPAQLLTGHWARWESPGSVLWLRIDEIRPDATASPPSGAPGLGPVEAIGPTWREVDLQVTGATPSSATLLNLDVQVSGRGAHNARLAEVGLTPEAGAAWWQHVSDAEFYTGAADESERPRVEDAAERPRAAAALAVEGRFPLAALPSDDVPTAWIPLGVQPAFETDLGALPQPGTALERDGLADFDESLFLDPELAARGLATLMADAEEIRFIAARPRSLFGAHAALSIGAGGLFNEVSLIAIPDAVHLGWRRRSAPDVPPPQETPRPAPAHWSAHRGPCAKPAPPPGTSRAGASPPDASPPQLEEPDFGNFLDCDTRLLAAPSLTGPAGTITPGAFHLAWERSDPRAEYELYEALLADFRDERIVHSGTADGHWIRKEREGIYYYRVVARLGDERSAPSNAIAVAVRAEAWNALGAADVDEAVEERLLRIHRALLRLCAASGDLFAVLSLPREFDALQAVRYAARLREVRGAMAQADSEALAFDEGRALSYGALYHPWLVSGARESPVAIRDEDVARGQRIVPPDGFVAGVLAQRASSRGAWIAPANEVLKDVVALTPQLEASSWQALQDAQVNVLRAEPRGFLALSADTLALDPEADVRPISVRRLVALLRRLALRRGTSYVFEPNGVELRAAVQRGFDILLSDLFRRGAFAGATPQQSFRVVTDETLNTPRDADAGRLIVELRVAPSLPMRFLAVRLAQRGERLAVTEVL